MSEKTTKITPEVQAMSDVIAKDIKIADDGTVDLNSIEKAYLGTLPEELHEPLKAIHDHRSVFFAASTNALGTTAVDHMVKHKNVELITAEFPMFGKDTFNVGVKRREEFPDLKDKEKTIVKYGAVTTKYSAYDSTTKVGQVKVVKHELAEAALKKLAEG